MAYKPQLGHIGKLEIGSPDKRLLRKPYFRLILQCTQLRRQGKHACHYINPFILFLFYLIDMCIDHFLQNSSTQPAKTINERQNFVR